MRNESEIRQRLSEMEQKSMLERDDLLEAFSEGFSAEGQSRLMPLAPYVEFSRRGVMQSMARMQAKGRADGWLDALHWVMESSVNR